MDEPPPWPPAFAAAIAALRAVIDNVHPILEDKYATVRAGAQYALGVPPFLVDSRVKSCIVKIAGIECEATWPSYIPMPLDMSQERLEYEDFAQRGALRVGFWLHGGGFCITGTNSFRHMFAFIALATDTLIISPNFRNAPEFPFPCALQDCLDTYKVMQPDFLGGESAGGALALATLLKLQDEGAPYPPKVVVLSPWVQLDDFEYPSWAENVADDILVPHTCKNFAEAYCPTKDFKNPFVSPGYADWTPFAGKLDVLVDVGSKEVFRDQVLAFERKLRESNVEVSLHIGNNMPHVYLAFSPLLDSRRYFPDSDRLLHTIACFTAETPMEPCPLTCHQRAEWEASASHKFCEVCFEETTWQEQVGEYQQMFKSMLDMSPQVTPRARRFERCPTCRQRMCAACAKDHCCNEWIFILRHLCCLSRLTFDEVPNVSGDVITVDTSNLVVANYRRLVDAWDPFYYEIVVYVDQLLQDVDLGLSLGGDVLAQELEGHTIRALVLIHLRLLVSWGLPRLIATAIAHEIAEETRQQLNDLIDCVEAILRKHAVSIPSGRTHHDAQSCGGAVKGVEAVEAVEAETGPGTSADIADDGRNTGNREIAAQDTATPGDVRKAAISETSHSGGEDDNEPNDSPRRGMDEECAHEGTSDGI